MGYDHDLELKDSSEPLMFESSGDEEEQSRNPADRRTHSLASRLRHVNRAILLPWSLLIALSAGVLAQYARQRTGTTSCSTQLLYSPAEVALDYEVRQFHLGFAPDTTEYQGAPSDEVDQKWSDLYDMGNTLLDKDQAMLIPNKTILFPHDPNHRYLVNLDVFHQLHCLNLIRQAFHPEYYKPHNPGPHAGDEDGLLGPSHISHCIDSIRQSLMCNADISVMNWVWNERKGQNQPIGQNYHTCRRFDKIQEWARQHATYEPVDVSFREMDDPLSTAG